MSKQNSAVPAKVVIVIRGGNVEAAYSSDPIVLEVIDYDNAEGDDNPNAAREAATEERLYATSLLQIL